MKIPTAQYILKNVQPVWENGDLYLELTKDMVFEFGKMCIVVPKTFRWEGTTTPFFLRAFISKYDPRFLAGSLLHDYILATQFVIRSVADELFRMILAETTTTFWRVVYYLGVKAGTINAWKKRRKQGLLKFKDAKKKANLLKLKK
jgi:hypothetical protein